MHQIRIIREMREGERLRGRTDQFIRPRYCVFENVPGLFSSNKGEDFRAVLTEFVRVAEPDAPDVPMPPKGKWPKSGWLYDEMGRWSVAWKQHDAQFHGVPQRRKRIAVVADFNGLSAPAILFDPQYRRETEGAESDEAESDTGGGRSAVQTVSPCLSGDIEPSGTEGEGTSFGTQGGVAGTDSSGGTISFQERAGKPGGARESSSKVSEQEHCLPSTTKAYSIQGNTIDRDVKQNGGGGITNDVSHTLNTTDRHGVFSTACDVYNQTVEKEDISGTVTAETGIPNHSGPKVMQKQCTGKSNAAGVDCRNGVEHDGIGITLQAKPNG